MKKFETPSRFFLIDVLRGISILLVILLHTNIRFHFERYSFFAVHMDWWKILFRSGGEGVRIFFTISGFLITWTSLKRWGEIYRPKVREFFVYRFARIMPLLLLLLLVLSVLHHMEIKHYIINIKRFTYWEALFSALTFHLNYLEGMRGYLPASWDVLWSLSVEEVFYISFPIIAFISRSRWTFILVMFGMIIYGPLYRAFFSEGWLLKNKAYFACFDSIAIGCLGAMLFYKKDMSRKLSSVLFTLGALLIIFRFYMKINKSLFFFFEMQIDETILGLGTLSFILGAIHLSIPDLLKTLLKPLALMGKLCYEIYLTHMFVIWFIFDEFLDMKGGQKEAFILIPVIIVMSSVLAYVIEKFFSKPLNKYLRRKLIQ